MRSAVTRGWMPLDATGSGEVIMAYYGHEHGRFDNMSFFFLELLINNLIGAFYFLVADFCVRHRCQNVASCVKGHTCLCNDDCAGTFCELNATR